MDEQNYFNIDSSNTKTYNEGTLAWTGHRPLNFNGVDVFYFPKSYVQKGVSTGSAQYYYPSGGGWVPSGGNALWQGDLLFLEESTYDYLKPAKLDSSIVDELVSKNPSKPTTVTRDGIEYIQSWDLRDVPDYTDGYIIDTNKYYELTQQYVQKYGTIEPVGSPYCPAGGCLKGFSPVQTIFSPPRIPDRIGTAPDGSLAYIGYTEGGSNDQRYDITWTSSQLKKSTGFNAFYKFQYYDCGRWGCSFDKFLGSDLFKAFDFIMSFNPYYALGKALGNFAFNDGNIGNVALAIVGMNTPNAQGVTAAQNTIFEIPQIASATSSVANFFQANLGLDAASAASAARVTLNTGLTYLANGQNFEDAFKNAAATFVGQEAGAKLASSLTGFSGDFQKITQATTSAATRAALLNQDVEKAATSAFVSTSIPLAVNGALKQANLTIPDSVKNTISNAAVAAALLPNANINEVIKSAVVGGIVDGALSKVKDQLVADKVISASDSATLDKVKNYLGSFLSGRSVDEIINQSIIKDALSGAEKQGKDYVAQDKGWQNWDQWSEAKALYGPDVTFQFYEDRAVTREKINKVLEEEGVPESERQNFIDFYQGRVGKDNLASEVLADLRQYVNPLYASASETEYVTKAFKGLEEFDPDFYKEEYEAALKEAKAGNFARVEEIANFVNRSYTTSTEAERLLKEAFAGVGEGDYQPTQEQINAIKGQNQVVAFTVAQNIASIQATTFNGSQYATPQEAAAEARNQGYNNFIANDGKTYKVMSAIDEALIRDDIEKKGSFTEAYASARSQLGDGKTFLWGGKQYTTGVLPDTVFDGSRNSDIATAATAAYAAGKTSFVGPDGKLYNIPAEAKGILENAVNQSPAETKRLLATKLTEAPNEFLAETQRLMEAPGRSVMDNISAATSQALGFTARGFGNFLTSSGKTYAGLTGDLSFDNAVTRLGAELENYAKGQDVYGVDVQKERLRQAIAFASEKGEERVVERTDEFGNIVTTVERAEKPFWEKASIIGGAVKNNFIGFVDIAGSEIVEEIPTLAAMVATTVATGGANIPLLFAISASGTILETFGTSTESVYKQAKAMGMDEQTAIDKAYLNGITSTLLEIGPDFVADKFLVSSLLKNTGNILANVGRGVASNAAVGSATGFVSGASQSYAEQLILNPDTANFDKAISDGIFESFVGGAAGGGLALTGFAFTPNSIIGKDYKGDDVTLSDVLTNTKVVDSSTINPNVVVGITDSGNDMTLGGVMTSMPNLNFNDQVIKTILPQVFDNPNLIVGKDSLGNNVTYAELASKVTPDKTFTDVFNSVINVTPEQKEQVQKDFLRTELQTIGFTPTVQQLDELLVQSPDSTQDLINNAKRLAFQSTAANQKVTLSDQELQTLLDPASKINTIQDLIAYLDPRGVQEQEVRDMYASLGLPQPTQADIDKLVGEYAETELAAKAQENLEQARFNSIFAQLDQLSVGATPEVLNTINLLKADLLNQIQAVGGDIGKLSETFESKYGTLTAGQKELVNNLIQQGKDFDTAINEVKSSFSGQLAGLSSEMQAQYNALNANDKAIVDQLVQQGQSFSAAIQNVSGQLTEQITNIQTSLTDAIAAARAEGLQGDAALQRAIDTVSTNLGTTRSDLLNQLGTTEAALRADFASQLGGISADLQTKYDALTAEQKALADQLVQQGTTLTEAINQVTATLSADLQAKYDALSAADKAIVDQLVAQGQNFNAALNTVEARITADTQAKYDALTAEQKAIADRLTQQGVELNTAINAAKGELQAELGLTQQEIQRVADLVGKPARNVTQADIDFVNSIITQQQTQPDVALTPEQLAYDVNRDQKIDQKDIDILTGVLTPGTTPGEPFAPPPGSPWAPTGIYAELAEQKRQEDIKNRIATDRSMRAQQQAQAQALAQQQLNLLTGQQQPIPEDPGAKFKQPFITSTAKQEQFKGPLQEFMQEVQQGDYTQDQFAAPQSQTTEQIPQNIDQGGAMPSYFTYGQQTDIDQLFNPFGGVATGLSGFEPMLAARGGLATPLMAAGGVPRYAAGGLPVIPHSGKMRVDFRSGAAVSGPGDGQSDDIPAMLADGEFVFPADVVAALGNGSTKAGSEKLYDMMHSIRAHHRSARPEDLPPPAKSSPLDYLKGSKKPAKAARR